jgi:hypothetical protein
VSWIDTVGKGRASTTEHARPLGSDSSIDEGRVFQDYRLSLFIPSMITIQKCAKKTAVTSVSCWISM